MECLDDAKVAVQLEPTLIKAIEKGGFFNHKPSTFFFSDFVKRGLCGLWQVTAPSTVSAVSMSFMWVKSRGKCQ